MYIIEACDRYSDRHEGYYYDTYSKDGEYYVGFADKHLFPKYWRSKKTAEKFANKLRYMFGYDYSFNVRRLKEYSMVVI